MIKIKYFVYVRKSQDRSDRQIMSIQGQINEIKKFARERGLSIVEIFIEQESAKKPGRPIFNKMIERISNGEANGILCWKLNRLARNPVDAGTISWLLQGNIIRSIHAKDRSYLPTDNVLMMQIDFGIANQFVKDLSGDVKRGMKDKAESGWCPQSSLPVGYVHHPEKQKASEQIIPDPQRFHIVSELWRRMETGAYSVLAIKKIAEQLGLRNPRGKFYNYKTFYRLFENPMYYGKFHWTDENGNKILWEGKHVPMISEYSFRKVQQLLRAGGRKNGPERHAFTYRGLITCGECGGHVTAERKQQAVCTKCNHKYSTRTNEFCRMCNTPLSEMNNPRMIDITYYRCTKRINVNCSQKAIAETKIETILVELLEQVSIEPELCIWFQKYIGDYIQKKHKDSEILVDSMTKQVKRLEEKKQHLIDLRVSGEISKEDAIGLQEKYQKETLELEDKIFEKSNAQDIEFHETKEYINFAKNCVYRFKNGSKQEKKELIAFFCSNLILLDKNLYFSTKKAPDVLSCSQVILFSNITCSNLKLA